jgi:hypothetical protein
MPLRIATEEQRRRRAVFSATRRAAVFWVPAGVARSTGIRTETGASLAPWPAPKPQAARIMHSRDSTLAVPFGRRSLPGDCIAPICEPCEADCPCAHCAIVDFL